MYIAGKRIHLGERKIYRIWDPTLMGEANNSKVRQEVVPYMHAVYFLMKKDTAEVLKLRFEIEHELKNIAETIELIQASPATSSTNIHIDVNINVNNIHIPFASLIPSVLNKSPKNITDLINIKHELEAKKANCDFYLHAIKNLSESLEVFNDEEKIRILGALFQFRDDKNRYTRLIAKNPYFKHDVENWGFTGNEANFNTYDDRVSNFRDDIANRFEWVKIDEKHIFSLDDFDDYLNYYTEILKKYIKDLMIH